MDDERTRLGAGRVGRDDAVWACFGAVGAALSTPMVSVMAEIPSGEVAVMLRHLASAGALAEVELDWFLPTARTSSTSALSREDDRHDRRARLLSYMSDQTAPGAGLRWSRPLRALLDDVLAWPVTAPMSVQMCELVTCLWAVTADDPDLSADDRWRRQLTTTGERAARAGDNPVRLAALLDRAGHAAASAGDMRLAESQLVRALEAWQAVRDESRADAALRTLIRTFADTGRWARALDAAFVLLDEHRRRGSDAHTAATLALIGDCMIGAGRPEDALGYLSQAEQTWDRLGHHPSEHAQVLVVMGRLLWPTKPSAARRSWHRALALLIDVDDDAADHVRALLRLSPADALPPPSPATGSGIGDLRPHQAHQLHQQQHRLGHDGHQPPR